MDVSKILDGIRTEYISVFVNEVANVQKQGFVALEPAKMQESGDYLTQGDLDLPSRNDCLLMADDQVKKLSLDPDIKHFDFEPVHRQWNDKIKVSIYPFHWGQCDCRFFDNRFNDEQINWHYLRQWYLKWFDEGMMDIHGFSGCLHSMSDPVPVNNGFRVLIDFGSAPIAAFEDMIETAEIMGFRSATIGTTSKESKASLY